MALRDTDQRGGAPHYKGCRMTMQARYSGAARWRRYVLAVAAAVGCCLTFLLTISPAQAQEITPDSPGVRTRVDRAIAYLESSNDGRLGAKALVGLTLIKYGKPKDHAKIKDAVATIQAGVKVGPKAFAEDIYSTGIAILFLVAVDPSKYRPEIDILVQSLHYRQKPAGAWGYPLEHETNGQSCDTSMTQYAVLGMWEAEDQAGVETPPIVWDRAARWFLLTQAPNGGFGYQGKPSSDYDELVAQASVKHSMSAAAMGSLFIVKDRLGVYDLKKRQGDDTPAALAPFETPEERRARLKTRIPLKYFSRATGSGNRWMEANYSINKLAETDWMYYSLYALERYETLKAASEAGKTELDESPEWYQQGARVLFRNQKTDGSWESNAGAVPDTCFATLFLLRSMRKSLEKSSARRHEAGIMVAGRGFPEHTDVRLRDGRLVSQPLTGDGSVHQALEVLEVRDDENYDAARETLADLARNGPRDALAEHSTELARLATSGGSEVRVLAIEAIQRSRNLDHVPLLIYLLNDPNSQVVNAASVALGSISRKFTTFGLGADPTPDQRQRAIDEWKAWYGEIRPDVDVDAFDPS